MVFMKYLNRVVSGWYSTFLVATYLAAFVIS